MKKVVSGFKRFIFGAALSVLAFAAWGGKAKAATPIALNTDYKESLDCNSTYEYTFTTPNEGSIALELAVDGAVRGNSISREGSTIQRIIVDYKDYSKDHSWAGDGFVRSRDISVPAGKTATVRIETGSVSEKGSKLSVAFRVVNDTPANFETEGNDTASSADKIKAGKTYNGILLSDSNLDDTDWYVFKAPKAGKYSFKVVNKGTDYEYFCADLYKKKNKLYKHVVSRSGEGWQNLGKIKLRKGQKVYIKLFGSYPDSHYSLKVKKVK